MPQLVKADLTAHGVGEDALIYCSNHPVLAHKLTKLRDKRTDCTIFRHILREVTFYLGYVFQNVWTLIPDIYIYLYMGNHQQTLRYCSRRYEATHDFDTKSKQIETPFASHDGSELATRVALVPILRAGLGMVEPMLDLIPQAKVHHIGMYRTKDSLLPIQYYNKLPKECQTDVAVILEPMIATAATIHATVSIVKFWGAKRIKILTAVASTQGLKEMYDKHPDVEIYVGAIDARVSDVGKVLPGMGDVGDRQFGTIDIDEAKANAKRARE